MGTKEKKAEAAALVAAIATQRESNKVARASVTEANRMVKQATAAANNAKDGDVAGATTILKQWVEAQNARETAVEDGKTALSAQQDVLKALKVELQELAKTPRVQQNGQVFPRAGTISATLWDIFDAAAAAKGAAPAIDEVVPSAEAAGVCAASIRAGYAHWRRFHGITGRVESVGSVAKREAKEAEREAAKAERAIAAEAKRQEKAAAKAAPEAAAA